MRLCTSAQVEHLGNVSACRSSRGWLRTRTCADRGSRSTIGTCFPPLTKRNMWYEAHMQCQFDRRSLIHKYSNSCDAGPVQSTLLTAASPCNIMQLAMWRELVANWAGASQPRLQLSSFAAKSSTWCASWPPMSARDSQQSGWDVHSEALTAAGGWDSSS